MFLQRNDNVFNGRLWEFPGGKVEDLKDIRGEALREVREELLGKYEITNLHQLSEFTIDSTSPKYPDHKIRFIIFVGDLELPLSTTEYSDRLRPGNEHQSFALLDIDEIEHFAITEEAKTTLRKFKRKAPA